MWPLFLLVNAFITIQLVFHLQPLICPFFSISTSSSSSAWPPSASSAPPIISYTPPPPPHLTHLCLSSMSMSVHFIPPSHPFLSLAFSYFPIYPSSVSLPRCSPFFPPWLRWWSRLVVSVKPAPLRRGYGFNLEGRLRTQHINNQVSDHNDLGRDADHTPAQCSLKNGSSLQKCRFSVRPLCCSLLLSPCVCALTYTGYESHWVAM